MDKDINNRVLIAQNLAYLRREKGLKQKDFARIGIKLTTYNNYERGVSDPDMTTLKAFASFYNVSIEELVNKDLRAQAYMIKPTSVEEIKLLRQSIEHAKEKILWLQEKNDLLEKIIAIYQGDTPKASLPDVYQSGDSES